MGIRTSSDQIAIRAQRMIRVAQSSIDMSDWNRAKVAITALCAAKIKLTYQKPCANCQVLKDSEENFKFYSCCHQYCFACLDQILCTSCTSLQYKCPNCTEGFAPLSAILQYKARFGESLSQTLQEKVDFYIKKHGVLCSVCMGRFLDSKDLYLTKCGDHVCLGCLEEYSIQQIDASEPHIKLPCHHDVLHQNELKRVIRNQDFQKYLKFSLRGNGDGKYNQEEEQFIFCQNVLCGQNEGGLMGFVVSKSVQVAPCPNCYAPHCPRCAQLLKDGNHQCLAGKIEDPGIQKQIDQGELQKCPKCGMIYTHGGGCYYLTCDSARCQRKTSFCFICGKLLVNENLHFDHFPDGPFYRNCNTLAKIPDPQYY